MFRHLLLKYNLEASKVSRVLLNFIHVLSTVDSNLLCMTAWNSGLGIQDFPKLSWGHPKKLLICSLFECNGFAVMICFFNKCWILMFLGSFFTIVQIITTMLWVACGIIHNVHVIKLKTDFNCFIYVCQKLWVVDLPNVTISTNTL